VFSRRSNLPILKGSLEMKIGGDEYVLESEDAI